MTAWLAINGMPLLTLTGTAVAGIFALFQWSADQRWKRKAAIIERLKSFDETPGCRNAMMILKSAKRSIPLWDPAEPPERRYVDVSWADAKLALVPSAHGTNETPKASAIRDSFEDFINRLTQIEIYVRSGLLDLEDARLVAEQWARRLDGSTPDHGLTRAFRIYVTAEHKMGLLSLFARFGVDLTASDDDKAAFEADLASRVSAHKHH